MLIPGTNVTLTKVNYKAPEDIVMADVIALDPSIRSTGLCVVYGGDMWTGLLQPAKSNQRGMERLLHLQGQWMRVLDYFHDINTLCIENYAYGAKDSHAHGLGEVGGLYRLKAYERGLRIIAPTPGQIKKLTTGSGSAQKDLMIKEVFKRFGVDTDDNNIADAVAIAFFFGYGYAIKQGTAVQLPQKNQQALIDAIKENLFDGERIAHRIRTPRKAAA